MSGGSHNYISFKLESALNLPSAHYSNLLDPECETLARTRNPMHDKELSEMIFDIACLLHSLEWADSGDTSDESYKRDVMRFKEKWFNLTEEQRIEAYKKDLRDYADKLISEITAAHGRQQETDRMSGERNV